MLSHRNARCFVDWCSDVFEPTEDDRFSSHAPFHFDLSILDLYVPLKHGATVVLFGESLGKEPARLAQKIAERRITIWYSAPSILTMLVGQGATRAVRLVSAADGVVCGRGVSREASAGAQGALAGAALLQPVSGRPKPTSAPGTKSRAKFPPIEPSPIPSAKSAPTTANGSSIRTAATVPDGAEGELCISGPGVMQGYWNLPEQNAACSSKTPTARAGTAPATSSSARPTATSAFWAAATA